MTVFGVLMFFATLSQALAADLPAHIAAQAIAAYPTTRPVNILFDTDMDSDCDDTGALAVLHALADRGEANILATVSCSKNPWTGPCIEAINAYYGRADLPIGAPRGQSPAMKSAYTRGVAEAFPHELKTTADAPDTMEVYRKVLESAPDGSVVLVTVGSLGNVANFLDLPAGGDHRSGLDLVRAKVRLWACMGGNFIGTPARDNLKLGNHNFEKDREGALRAIAQWPQPLVFVGREIGSVPSGLKAGACLSQTPETNPVRLAYKLYFHGSIKDRHIADPTTVLFAVRGLRDYWNIHATGKMDLHPDMTFEWKEGPPSNQAYLLKRTDDGKNNDRYVEQTCEELMIQPPRLTHRH
jgi:hypothetical protein